MLTQAKKNNKSKMPQERKIEIEEKCDAAREKRPTTKMSDDDNRCSTDRFQVLFHVSSGVNEKYRTL